MVDFEIKPLNEDAKKALISLELVDEIGIYSDELTLTFPNSFKRPEYKKELTVFIDGHYYGVFVVQTTNKTDKNLIVKATATNFTKELKEKKNRSFENIKLCAIVSKIANEHGLESKCDFDILLKYESQTNESDLNFLHRLADKFNAQFNIKDNKIIFLKHKEENKNLPKFFIKKNEVISYSIKHKAKTIYKSVIAKWQDTKENKIKTIIVGAGKPQYELQDSFKNEAEANSRAKALLEILNKGSIEGNISLPGKEIRAGGILVLEGFDEDDGEYSINKVTHTINQSGYIVKVSFRK